MSLVSDFNHVPCLANREYRLPSGDFLPTTPARVPGEPAQPAHNLGEFQPSYRMPDCVEAMRQAFRGPLTGMFSPGLAQ